VRQEKVEKSMGKALKILGTIIILFGLLLFFGSPIGGIIVMLIGVLMCYSGGRSDGNKPLHDGGVSDIQRTEHGGHMMNQRHRRVEIPTRHLPGIMKEHQDKAI
jgi:hypothetical protein